MKLSEILGDTYILSPLKRKLRRLGVLDEAALDRLAYQRGCKHYGVTDIPELESTQHIQDWEIGIALLSGENEYDPMKIRMGAQLISRASDPYELYSLAKKERCLVTLNYIAKCASKFDKQKEFWDKILIFCSEEKPLKEGILPHWSRFVLQTGMTNPFNPNQQKIEWIR